MTIHRTPVFDLPYMDDLHPLNDLDAITQEIAETTESVLIARGVPSADLVSFMSAVAAAGGGGPGALLTDTAHGITTSAGWTIASTVGTVRRQKLGLGWFSLDVTATYTGADITVPTNTNIGDFTPFTLPASIRPLAEWNPAWCIHRDLTCSVWSDGQLRISAVGGSAPFTAGAYRFFAQYRLATP